MIIYLLLALLFTPTLVLPQENPDLKKTVAFIFGRNVNGEYYAKGTGFFVSIPHDGDSTRSWIFLTTAKHVVKKKGQPFEKEVFLRLNLHGKQSEFVRLPIISQDSPRYFVHSDSTVDLVVLKLPSFDINRYDVLTIGLDMMSTDQFILDRKIREGDDVLFCGMFSNFLGMRRNYPILRFGKVALLSDERIPFDGDIARLYLLESTTFGGNSGSPVFFKLSPNREPGILIIGRSSEYYLAGVMRGFYGAGIDTAIVSTSKQDTILFQNSGIAAVTPSDYLVQILQSIRKSMPK